MNFLEFFKKDSSLKVLLAANLITIILAVVFNWNVFILLWGYWCQSIIIGFFTVLKILRLKDFGLAMPNFRIRLLGILNLKIPKAPVQGTLGLKLFYSVFFIFHYGFFHLGYSFFLASFMLFQGGFPEGALNAILLVAGIFFVNHLFSFLFFERKQIQKQSINRVFSFPYARIVPMHLTIIAAGFFLASGVIIGLLVFFLLLKTLADLFMHYQEHKQQL